MGLPEPPPLGAAMVAPDTLAGEVAVVTGGGTGLGRAIAVELARAGAADEEEKEILAFARKLTTAAYSVTVDEVARVVDFFAGPLGAFVSGQVVRVDGAGQAWPA